jgi:hypothetical protein
MWHPGVQDLSYKVTSPSSQRFLMILEDLTPWYDDAG